MIEASAGNNDRASNIIMKELTKEYMGCPESLRTFKIARHCVNLVGRGKCYSLVMSLVN